MSNDKISSDEIQDAMIFAEVKQMGNVGSQRSSFQWRFVLKVLLGRTVFLGVLPALLVCGCMAIGKESSLKVMTPQEKQLAEKLSQIRKGMTRDEVVAILGTPDRRLRVMGMDEFDYKLNSSLAFFQATYNSPELSKWNTKGGVTHIEHSPAGAVQITTVTPVETWDAVVTVSFSHDRVTRVKYVGSFPRAFFYDVVK